MSASPRLSPSAGQPQPGAERRAHARHCVVQDQIVAVSFEGDNGGLMLDVSQQGCSVQAVGPLESGKTTEFDFVLPSTGKRLRGRGEVRWAEKTGRAGLRFLEFSRGSLADLTAWLARPAAPPVEGPRTPPAAAPVPFEPSELESEVAGLSGDEALAHIATRLRDVTRASGVAIAIGAADEMICRASVGAAPTLGAKLQANSGLSGECVRSRVLVRCDDTETDSRVDAAVCRQLDLRSAVLVPVLRANSIVGVLEVFSNVPRAFGSVDILRLTRTAELIGSALVPRRSEPQKDEVAHPFAPAIATKEVDQAEVEVPPVSPDKEPVAAPVAAPEPSQPVTAVAAPAPAPVRRSPAAAPRPPLRVKKLTRAERSALLAARQQPAVPDFAPAEQAPTIQRSAKIGFAVAGVLVLLAIGILVRPRSNPAPVQAAPVSNVAATTPAVTTPPITTETITPASKTQTKAEAAKEAKPKPAETAPVITVAPDEIRQPGHVEEQSDVAEPPTISVPTVVPTLALGRTVVPSPSPRTSSGLVAGKLVHRVAPVYPPAAYSAHITGDVELTAVIRPDGTIGTVEVVKGNPILAQAAVDAVRQWRYEPYRLDGAAVEATAAIHLTFSARRAYGIH